MALQAVLPVAAQVAILEVILQVILRVVQEAIQVTKTISPMRLIVPIQVINVALQSR